MPKSVLELFSQKEVLNYLKENDVVSYRELIKKLNLRK